MHVPLHDVTKDSRKYILTTQTTQTHTNMDTHTHTHTHTRWEALTCTKHRGFEKIIS